MLDVICAFQRCDIDLEQNHRLHIRHKLDLFDLTGKAEHVTHGDRLFQQRGWGNEIEQAAAASVDIETIKGDGGRVLSLQERLFGDIKRFADPLFECFSGIDIDGLLNAAGIGFLGFRNLFGRAQNRIIANIDKMLVQLVLLLRLAVFRTGAQQNHHADHHAKARQLPIKGSW